MRKINAREFQKNFSKVAGELEPGQIVAVTKRDKPLGFFTKAPAKSPIPMPDFAANLAQVSYRSEDAEKIIREVVDDAVS